MSGDGVAPETDHIGAPCPACREPLSADGGCWSCDNGPEPIDVRDWTFEMEGQTFPFVEDENANITGLGWQDYNEFADAVNRYDDLCNGEPMDPDDRWESAHIGHRWALLDPDGERLWTKHDGEPVTHETPGAVRITTLWGQR